MSAINKDVSEEQLHDIFYAEYAICKEQGDDDNSARYKASIWAYAVFRNVVTLDSMIQNIVKNARKVFNH